MNNEIAQTGSEQYRRGNHFTEEHSIIVIVYGAAALKNSLIPRFSIDGRRSTVVVSTAP
jgi:hypothetical protein